MRQLCALVAAIAAALVAFPADAQSLVQWTTNYYSVTGATLPEIHRSLRQQRPWKERQPVDGWTEWRVEWRFSVAPGEGGCRLAGLGTKTIIQTTLPRWVAPTNAAPGLQNAWSNYVSALALHESGHAAVAFGAAAEIQKRLKAAPAGADCSTLTQTINNLGEQVLAEYRQRDKEYDERTQRGATQGASLPSGRRRDGSR